MLLALMMISGGPALLDEALLELLEDALLELDELVVLMLDELLSSSM